MHASGFLRTIAQSVLSKKIANTPKHNWNNIGLRLTESGSVKISNVKAPWTDAFGWDPDAKKPIESLLKIPFATLLLPT